MKARDVIPLRAAAAMLAGLQPDEAGRIVESAGDLALILDSDGRIVDLTVAGDAWVDAGIADWLGTRWEDTVAIDSQKKVREMIAAAVAGQPARWRQVNHVTPAGDVPVRYRATGIVGGRIVAVGHDLRELAAMQQRLMQAQQSLERDYLQLRNAESRYRMLFDLGAEPVLIVDSETRQIKEANPAAAALVGVRTGALANRAFTSLFDAADQDSAVALLGSATAADHVAPVMVHVAGTGKRVTLAATAFRQDRATFLLVRLGDADAANAAAGNSRLIDVVDHMPDAFVLTGARQEILAANHAFVEMTQAVAFSRLKGAPISDWLGRAGIDVELIIDQLREHGAVRNVATILRGADGTIEQVEVSAVSAPGPDGDCCGFVIRNVGRRVRDLPPAERDLPRSVEQLTQLVGRMSLKDIVRESTDLIERLCIEAALQYTSDNRASAAEILGVSRQSLYSKLHRHGIGNLVGDDE